MGILTQHIKNVISKQLWAAQDQNQLRSDRNGGFHIYSWDVSPSSQIYNHLVLATCFFFLLKFGVREKVSCIFSALIQFQFLCIWCTHIQVGENSESTLVMESSKRMTGFATVAGIEITLLFLFLFHAQLDHIVL